MLFPIIAVVSWGIVAKATVLLTIAMLVAFALRKNSAAFRHLVWCLALAGIIGVFAVSKLAPSMEVAILPAVTATNDVTPRVTVESAGGFGTGTVTGYQKIADGPNTDVPNAVPPNAFSSTFSDLPRELGPPASHTLSTNDSSQVYFSVQNWVTIIWIAGFAVCISPLIVGLIRIEFLRKASCLIVDGDALNLLNDCREELGVSRKISFLELDNASPPMTSGVFQVNILLPAIWREWSRDQLKCVLMHELAHIKRLDVAWYLLGRTACAIFWFHPLAWFGLHRLKTEREVASDDLVVATGKKATDYSTDLLAVARSCMFFRPIVGGVAMAGSTKLENRILQLLDPSLKHGSVSFKRRVAMLAISSLLVGAIGIFQPVAKSTDIAIESTIARSVETGDNRTDKNPIDNNRIGNNQTDTILLAGIVLGPDEKPLAQASVEVLVYSRAGHEKVSKKLISGPDGKFSAEVKGTDFKNTAGKIPEFAGSALVTADGFGFGTAYSLNSKEAISNIKINLVNAGRPFKGQIVDLEGKPVSGVSVKVIGLGTPQKGKISTFIDALPDAYEARALEREHLSFSQLTSHIPVVKTSESGRFEFKNIGEERMLMLRIDGATIESKLLNVLPAEMKVKTLPDYAGTDLGTTIYYGYDFCHAAANADSVTGRVVDIETGKPIPGVKISAEPSLGGSVFVQTLEATSDDSGNFTIMGIPSGRPAELMATIDDRPYFEQRIKVAKDERAIDVKLKKGIWITGKVTNEDGNPIESAVFYFVNNSNPNRTSVPGFAGGMERGWIVKYYMTKKDGSFRRVGFPGPGILAVRATGADAEPYPMGVGAEGMKGLEGMEPQKMLDTSPSFVLTSNFHRIVAVSPDKDDKTLEKNIQLQPDNVLRGQVFDNEGKPLSGYSIIGNRTMSGWRPAKSSAFDLYSYDPEKPRRLVFLHQEKKLAGTMLVEGRSPDDLKIKLQPWCTITGRILDEDGSPKPGAIVCSLPNQNSIALPRGKFRTDRDGRFRIEGLAPGAKYGISVRKDGRILKISIVEDLKLEPGEEKDLGDLKLDPN